MCKNVTQITHRHEIYSVKLVVGERFIHLFIFNENCRNLWWKILSLHLLLQQKWNLPSISISSADNFFVRGIFEINLLVYGWRGERRGKERFLCETRECALECSWLSAIIMQYVCFLLSLSHSLIRFSETILM